ncbi:bifunctional diguanylate cyclase/phosphodiesterase [Plantactinospora sp. KBS50]|uniref:putative bifunctional diguanylate cyclase/phosphodiesterase n=1 Tax=Plantactinospora sp. KBS50 TaxID=2024580 RepID=UPI000BAAA584|nr:bifunctional diguanylate cyclase/phosphodiesterase [Plantactinospora sp. KBS50]ASW58104.1 GGDEF-domain containing protein [Plantactinospora sp. KBS50]
MAGQPRRDHETDRQLALPVGLVVVLATVVLAVALHAATNPFVSAHTWQTTAILTLLVIFGMTTAIRIRIRSTTQAIQWCDVAIIIGMAVAPPPTVVICTAVGVTIAYLFRRRAFIKSVFNVAKETVLAGAAWMLLHTLGWTAQSARTLPETLVPLIVAYCLLVVLDELVMLPVIALDTGTRVRQLFLADPGLRLFSAAARLLLIVGTVLILELDNGLLLAIPPVVVSLHLAYAGRLRSREERQAWQRLARTTDALNVVDPDLVLRTAVARSAELFSADEVEVELFSSGRLIRGDSDSITYDGPTNGAPETADIVIPAALTRHDDHEAVGEVRLRFHGPVRLSEREHYTLRTFASALCTAIRNADAYAELDRVAREQAHAATHDALTGLPNRRHLLDTGTELLRRQHADGVVALLLIDLNHFKEINDTLGHAAGDQVLTQVADRLRSAVRDEDLVARLGGDEFAVLFRGLPAPAVAAHRAEALFTSLHKPFDLDGMRISVEASGGIASAPNAGGMAELLRRADVAMYQAKRSGRRITTYVPAQDTADLGRLVLGGDLPRAVADDEFTVTFQPIVELNTGEVMAAEALARWQHPVHGMMDPLRFIDAVERSGLLPAFTEAVLDQSLIAARSWREAGFELPVAVNVSPRSLLDARFPGAVLARLRAHDLPPDGLILELTETLALSQLEVVDQVLNQLRNEGVRLALDDFGTGYSSLSMLSRIPVHELKIDREFVMAMENSAEASAVIRSTVDLGRSLGLVVVAEGVESEPQRQALWELGCAAGQGHLFARPMAASRLLVALQQGAEGRPGTLAPPLHEAGSVIRLSPGRRTAPRRPDRLPHLPA